MSFKTYQNSSSSSMTESINERLDMIAGNTVTTGEGHEISNADT